jgi:hypothetical protein
VIPFEPWDLLVGSRSLFERRDDADFDEAVAAAVVLLREGTARTRSASVLPSACRDVSAVVVGGGGARQRTCDAIRRGAGVPATLAPDAEYGGERGGFALLASAGIARDGVVVDVGQSSIKVSSRGTRRRIPRPLERDHDGDLAGPSFVVRALRTAAITGDVEGLVIALPCAIDVDGTLGSSSYAGFEGRTDLLAEALSDAGLRSVPTWIVNDAELAALSAAERSSYAPGATILVLTIGFGVGGALLRT